MPKACMQNGGAHAITGTASLNLRLPGQWFQAETGLHYNWHRSYDPSLGRYTQVDPLGFVDGPGVYGYAGGSPQRFVDRDGRFATILPPSSPPSGAGATKCGWVKNVCRVVSRWIPSVSKFGLAVVCEGIQDDGKNTPIEPPEDYVSAGRWMSRDEYEKMIESGRVVESDLESVTSVTSPPNPGAWKRQTDGEVFVEFDVPASAIRARDASDGTAKIYGPGSIFGRGGRVTQMPAARNIRITGRK